MPTGTQSNERLAAARKAVERAIAEEDALDRKRTAGSAMDAAVARVAVHQRRSRLHCFLVDNGLTIAALSLFVLAFVGQVLTGVADENRNRRNHGQGPETVAEYMRSGPFVEVTAENWESEFLQMGVFVVLTAMLYQRGASESKSCDTPTAVDQDPREGADDPDAPWPVRRGGFALAIYRHSLSLALFTLFALSFAVHAAGGAAEFNAEQRDHGAPTVTTLGYLGTSRFWFESFQNWQSEFLSVGVLVLLSIWLREHGSPQSKPVAAPHDETGE